MSQPSLLVACAFVLAVGCLVALIDRWRESRTTRLRVLRTGRSASRSSAAAPAPPSRDRRAA